MNTMCPKDLPPPIRKPKRRLTLKTAIATMSGKASETAKRLMDPIGQLPTAVDGKLHEIEANLLELQADIIIREGLLRDKEKQLQFRERELDERDALLEAHHKIIRSSSEEAKQRKSSDVVSDAEHSALDALKCQLELQESSLKDAQKVHQERED
ncbi:MAG: hypothetical protein ABF322_00500 [Lentimonas sp.]